MSSKWIIYSWPAATKLYLTSDGSWSPVRVMALQYLNREKAQQVCNENRNNDPEFKTAVPEPLDPNSVDETNDNGKDDGL